MNAEEFKQGFTGFIEENELFSGDDHVLLAVSGGVDSVVMCDLFSFSGFSYGIAHCNFQLRGQESAQDEEFVKKLADRYQVRFYLEKFETRKHSKEKNISLQMAARELRYQWLEKIRAGKGFDWIATAHHRDDVMETMLFNLVRGTGIRGLHGILPRRGKIIRPLLFTGRKPILEFAKNRNIRWREDRTNLKTKYRRNLIRHKVIPVLKKINPSLDQTFMKNSKLFQQYEEILVKEWEQKKKDVVIEKKDRTYFSIDALKRLRAPGVYLYQWLTPYGFNITQIEDITRHLSGQPGKKFYAPGYVLEKDRDHLILYDRKPEQIQDNRIWINKTDRSWEFEGKQFTADFISFGSKPADFSDESVAYLDPGEMKFPLLLRHWEKGDRFYPLGMRQPKKVSDLFVDEKIPLLEKSSVLILESGGKIVWIVGIRIDHRFRVKNKTKKLYLLEVNYSK